MAIEAAGANGEVKSRSSKLDFIRAHGLKIDSKKASLEQQYIHLLEQRVSQLQKLVDASSEAKQNVSQKVSIFDCFFLHSPILSEAYENNNSVAYN